MCNNFPWQAGQHHTAKPTASELFPVKHHVLVIIQHRALPQYQGILSFLRILKTLFNQLFEDVLYGIQRAYRRSTELGNVHSKGGDSNILLLSKGLYHTIMDFFSNPNCFFNLNAASGESYHPNGMRPARPSNIDSRWLVNPVIELYFLGSRI